VVLIRVVVRLLAAPLAKLPGNVTFRDTEVPLVTILTDVSLRNVITGSTPIPFPLPLPLNFTFTYLLIVGLFRSEETNKTPRRTRLILSNEKKMIECFHSQIHYT